MSVCKYDFVGALKALETTPQGFVRVDVPYVNPSAIFMFVDRLFEQPVDGSGTCNPSMES